MIRKSYLIVFFCLLCLSSTNFSCFYNTKPLNLKYDSIQESIFDVNGNKIRSLLIQKFDSSGNFKGEITYRKKIDSVGSDMIFINRSNKDYVELTNLPMLVEAGYLYKAEAEILGFNDTLNFTFDAPP